MMKEELKPYVSHDTNWKMAIEGLFEHFMEFFFPALAKEIDYSKKPEFLEQEFHAITEGYTKDEKGTKGRVVKDKLIKVHLLDGGEEWILIHIEIEGTSAAAFSARMFRYFYRALDKYEKKIIALAVFIGHRVPKNKDQLLYSFHGTELSYKYNTYSIKDAEEEKLLKDLNPFALVVLAAKHFLKKDTSSNFGFKLNLVKLCRDRKYSDKTIACLFEFINLTLRVPLELEQEFTKELFNILEIKDMGNVVSAEHINYMYKVRYGITLEEKIKGYEEQIAATKKQLELERIAEREKAIINLLEKFDFSVEMIAETLSVSVADVEEIKQKIGRD